MWDINRLRVWRAVVSAGSVSAAARNLQYSPASVSQHIIALQQAAGFPIYRRVGRGIEITDAGHRLAQEAEAIFEAEARLSRLAESIRSGPHRRLTIGSFASATQEWIPEVLRECADLLPDVRFDVLTNEPNYGQDIPTGDLEIVSEFGDDDNLGLPGYSREVLGDDDYLVVLPRTHRLAEMTHVPMAELAQEPMVGDLKVTESATVRVIEHATRAAGFTPNFVARSDDHYGVLAMVGAGLGIAVLPRLAIGDLRPEFTARPLVDPVPVRTISLLVRHKVAHLDAVDIAVGAFRRAVRTVRGYTDDLDDPTQPLRPAEQA